MTRQLLIATSVALALSVSACGRDDDERADAYRTAPGANTAVTTPPALPQDNPSESATGSTSGTGAAGTASIDSAAQGAGASSGMGAGSTPDAAPQPYGSQSSSPATGTPSSEAGSTAR